MTKELKGAESRYFQHGEVQSIVLVPNDQSGMDFDVMSSCLTKSGRIDSTYTHTPNLSHIQFNQQYARPPDYPLRFQKPQETATSNLIPADNHKMGGISPVALVTQPPTMAPINVNRKATTRRSRFSFRNRNSLGSDIRSHRRLVMTTVGISLNPRARLATIWPAA